MALINPEVLQTEYELETREQYGSCLGCVFDRADHMGAECSAIPCTPSHMKTYGMKPVGVIWVKK